MLRSQLGEAVYRQAIQKYLERHALSEVTTENLREAFEEVSGRPLDKFFDQWVYHGGFPELKVEYRWLPEEKKAHVTVEQTQTVDDKTLLFELPTTLRFIVDGKARDEQVTIDGRRHDFYVSLPAEPSIVRFDPEYTVLGRIQFELPEKMLLAQLDRDDDALGRVLACDELAKRKTQAAVAGLRKALNGDKFYGVRNTAAGALRKIRTDEAVAALCESTDQEDARVRRQVIEELGKCYRDEARQALLRTIEAEKNPAVVAAAVRGLGRYQGDDSRDAMRKALASDTFTDDVPAAAFAAIRDLNDGALAEELMKTIKSRDAELDPRDLTEGMITVAKISQRGRRRDAAFHFLVDYLGHPRQFLRGAAIQALGELHEPDARELLEPIAASEHNETLAQMASAALAKLDKETPLASAEVGELRSDVRELRKAQDKLQKALDELKAKAKSSSKDNETSAQDDDQQKPSGDSDDKTDDSDKPDDSDQ
jgi:aminopeptidase N